MEKKMSLKKLVSRVMGKEDKEKVITKTVPEALRGDGQNLKHDDVSRLALSPWALGNILRRRKRNGCRPPLVHVMRTASRGIMIHPIRRLGRTIEYAKRG